MTGNLERRLRDLEEGKGRKREPLTLAARLLGCSVLRRLDREDGLGLAVA